MDSRRAVRRSRRNRKTRYREPRFDNRTRPNGWLPPSVKSRADNVINFVKKYAKLIPIESVVVERVSFDTSSMTNGDLKGRKLRDFIVQKNNFKCVYCGNRGEEIEHIIPKSKGGTNSVKNLTLSCRKWNIAKGNLSLESFGKKIGKDLSHLKPKKTPKQHYYDAMCIGENYKYKIVTNTILAVKAQGRGNLQMCR